MSIFPGSIFEPRTKANRNGVIYNPANSTVAYAEDLVSLDDEVVAIETELGENPKGAFNSVAAFLAALAGDVDDLISAIASKMSNPMSTSGDLIVGGANGSPSRLAVGTAGQILKVSANGSSLAWGAAPPSGYTSRFLSYFSSDVSVSSGITLIPFDSVRFDSLSEFSTIYPYSFIAKSFGYYFVSAQVAFTGILSTDRQFLYLKRNSSYIHRASSTSSDGIDFVQLSFLVYLNSGDSLSLCASSTREPCTLVSGYLSSFFSVFRFG